MKKLRHYFGEYEMTWRRVLILAVATAFYTALVNSVPALKDTSFQDIAINLECWFLFAIFIVVNCDKWWEASLKCFVFFLISQPLIYLIEVPFNSMGWQLFQYYPHWALITVLTLPGAAIAFQLKKKNWLSVLVLSVATGFLGFSCVTYARTAIANFPYHLLSAVFCFALAIFFVFVLLDENKHRIAALAIIAVVLAATVFTTGRGRTQEMNLSEGSWSCTVEDESIVSVEIEDGNHATMKAMHDGHSYVYFEKDDGTQKTYYVTVSGGSIWSDLIE